MVLKENNNNTINQKINFVEYLKLHPEFRFEGNNNVRCECCGKDLVYEKKEGYSNIKRHAESKRHMISAGAYL